MLTQYLGAGGLYRYCFVCLTSLTTGLVQVVSGGPTCVIQHALEGYSEGKCTSRQDKEKLHKTYQFETFKSVFSIF